ncbi:MAG: nucleotide exchange factor GrpE [Candidatus Omnitrophica bacterium]|nr:nucleotide exchange factor GrpE [Candidatus Omnitrophota bacterium]MCM8816152.1 nucleotide exchange factor GrpE [Candidatus Omnitrophota bacterium]
MKKVPQENERIIHIRERDFRRVAAFRNKAKQFEARCKELEEKVKNFEKEIAQWKERAARLAAEMENFKKRIEKEKEEFRIYLQASFAEKLLFFDEIFEKIVNDICSNPSLNKNIADGLIMLKKQSSNLLESLGVKKLESLGKQFDPMFHEAVEIVETDDKPEGTVIEEIRAGYVMNGKLLKPAQVKVSRGKNKDKGAGEA